MVVYTTSGTCARQIVFEIKDNKIEDVRFIGGCSGNLQAISKLVKGMEVDEAIKRLRGILCRNNTSCPDQFSKALEKYKEDQLKN